MFCTLVAGAVHHTVCLKCSKGSINKVGKKEKKMHVTKGFMLV